MYKNRPECVQDVVREFEARLDYFVGNNDYRAVFLNAYLLITKRFYEVLGRDKVEFREIFLDSDWVESLLVKFANLYLDSLREESGGYYESRTWSSVHRNAEAKLGTVLEDLLLGVNAHINVDLCYAIYLVLDAELEISHDAKGLLRRKFDYDQINRVLFDCIDDVEDEISERYGGAIEIIDKLMLRLDEALTRSGLRIYRDRVWSQSLCLLSAQSDREREIIREQYEEQALSVAGNIVITRRWPLSLVHRAQCMLRKQNLLRARD